MANFKLKEFKPIDLDKIKLKEKMKDLEVKKIDFKINNELISKLKNVKFEGNKNDKTNSDK